MASSSMSTPLVLRDPRFEAGRTLIQQGMANDGAIEIFSTLVEECIAKHGETSIETSPAFFEYGNALLRASLASQMPAEDEVEGEGEGEGAKTSTSSTVEETRNAAALAAEARQLQAQVVDANRKPPSRKTDDTTKNDHPEVVNKEKRVDENGKDGNGGDGDGEDEASDEGDGDDLQLSLEMMENAFSIMDEYQSSLDGHDDSTYEEWVKEQLPRVLLGIGDCLSALQRHADAADAYSRALEHRQSQLEKNREENLLQLQQQRRVCEATVLIAEELLACPRDQDVITTETNTLIVKSDERIEYARGYYDKARDSLQETVYLMGKLTAKKVELGKEKEDVCFLATMIMGVGETLAALDEQEAEKEADQEPAKKKAKRLH